MVCRRLLASPSATSHTSATLCSNSYNMARPPLLRSQLLQYRRLMLLHPQVLFPAHCYHAVLSAHKSLRIPPDMTQEVSCRSLKRSRSSHSLSSFSAAESQLLLPSRLDHKFPSHFSMLLCRRLHLVTSPRRCLRRRLIHWTRFCVMWPFKRLSMVPTLSLGCCCADDLTQYLVSACLYADGFSLSLLVFCRCVYADFYTWSCAT